MVSFCQINCLNKNLKLYIEKHVNACVHCFLCITKMGAFTKLWKSLFISPFFYFTLLVPVISKYLCNAKAFF